MNTTKFAVVLNRSIILSQLMSALGEMSVALGSQVAGEIADSDMDGRLSVYRAANSEELCDLRTAAASAGVRFVCASDGSGEYAGLAIYGPSGDVNQLMREFRPYTIPDMDGPLPGTGLENPNFEFFRRLGF